MIMSVAISIGPERVIEHCWVKVTSPVPSAAARFRASRKSPSEQAATSSARASMVERSRTAGRTSESTPIREEERWSGTGTQSGRDAFHSVPIYCSPRSGALWKASLPDLSAAFPRRACAVKNLRGNDRLFHMQVSREVDSLFGLFLLLLRILHGFLLLELHFL